jgi:hypothetical protein
MDAFFRSAAYVRGRLVARCFCGWLEAGSQEPSQMTKLEIEQHAAQMRLNAVERRRRKLWRELGQLRSSLAITADEMDRSKIAFWEQVMGIIYLTPFALSSTIFQESQ